MIYIEALMKPADTKLPKVFLAGGITNCPDWQQTMRKLLFNERCFLLNPRRANFPIHDPGAAFVQLEWEHQMVKKADLISYWVAKETIQPIVLFELGKYLDTYKNILIGIHPEYPRRQDVEIQTRLVRPDFKFVYSLEEHADQIRDWIAIRKGNRMRSPLSDFSIRDNDVRSNKEKRQRKLTDNIALVKQADSIEIKEFPQQDQVILYFKDQDRVKQQVWMLKERIYSLSEPLKSLILEKETEASKRQRQFDNQHMISKDSQGKYPDLE